MSDSSLMGDASDMERVAGAEQRYSDLTREEAHERITKVLVQSQLKPPGPMVHLPVEAITAEQILDALGWCK